MKLRADLSEIVYQRVGLSRTESAELVQSVLDEICDAAARGETVKLSGFGSFVVRSKGERVGRNPKTGVEVPILPRRVMVFKPSNVLKAKINGRERVGERIGASAAGAGSGVSRAVRPIVAREAEAPDFPRRAAASAPMEKSPEAFRTIREVADAMDLPQHVLRFWETRFPQIRPLKRAGGRRYYRPDDVERLRLIKRLLYDEGYTIKGVQKLFKEQGVQALSSAVDAGRRRAGRAALRLARVGARAGSRAVAAKLTGRRSRRRRAALGPENRDAARNLGPRPSASWRRRDRGTQQRRPAHCQRRTLLPIRAPSECSAARLAH